MKKLKEWFEKWVRARGWITKHELNDYHKSQEKREADKDKKITALEAEIRTLKVKLEEQPFQFDYLLSLYTSAKMNSLVYKLINKARNNPDTVELLQRWRLRVINAQETLQNGNEELKD